VCVCEFESACVCVCTKRAPVENSNNNDEITTCVGDFIFRGETGADGWPRRVVIGGQFTSHTRVLGVSCEERRVCHGIIIVVVVLGSVAGGGSVHPPPSLDAIVVRCLRQ
jgi:hypothetical protein